MDSALQEVSLIRGLKIKSKVGCESRSKKEIGGFVTETIDKKIPDEKLKNEEILYKALGLIPNSYNYKAGMIDLYTSQIGGYYDPQKKHYIMADWIPNILQTTVAVHELTHALQDQYFNLETFMDLDLQEGDALLARSALVEGDATAVMTDYARKIGGQPPLKDEESVQSILAINELTATITPELKNVPKSLKLLILFPYTNGLRFVHALLRTNGYEKVSEAFKYPPSTTEEILHPEKYINKTKDYRFLSAKEVLKDFNMEDWEVYYKETLGELGISLILGQTNSFSQTKKASEGWGGDRAFFVKKYNKSFLIWKTLWDSEKDASEFCEGYKKNLAKRSIKFSDDLNSEKAGFICGKDFNLFKLSLK